MNTTTLGETPVNIKDWNDFVIDTKLILVEGVPGSGKSTTAQYISHCLSKSGIANKWWYEEEQGHPVYLFNNEGSLQETIDDLNAGNYPKVMTKALKQWKTFSDSVLGMDNVILIDSTFFGYLTWTLFPMNVPIKEIEKYLAEVEHIISPCKPALIYLYQADIYNSLKNICEKRGGYTTERFIRNVSESNYGKERKLEGFDGMVSFWTDYRVFTDTIFEKARINKLSIENSKGNWNEYLQHIKAFLEIDKIDDVIIRSEEIDTLIGTYRSGEETCEVYYRNGDLYINGIQRIWPNSRLLPRSSNHFDVESLPIQAIITGNKLVIIGPKLLDGEINEIYFKQI